MRLGVIVVIEALGMLVALRTVMHRSIDDMAMENGAVGVAVGGVQMFGRQHAGQHDGKRRDQRDGTGSSRNSHDLGSMSSPNSQSQTLPPAPRRYDRRRHRRE